MPGIDESETNSAGEVLEGPAEAAVDAPPVDQTFTMTVDLATVKALGINLYSNAAAALSEQVANAYDADASKVAIKWSDDGEQITISDDGVGMTVEEANERFLTVGYERRSKGRTVTPQHDRKVMGRKGIGKLSVFSVADTVLVYTARRSDDNWSNVAEPVGFQLHLPTLLDDIKEGRTYHPKPVSVPAEHGQGGTTLVLKDLKTKRAAITSAALRRRLARRFDVVRSQEDDEHGFTIVVQDDPITYRDREDIRRVQFVWEFGENTIPDDALTSIAKRMEPLNAVVDGAKGWKISGWIGTAKTPDVLKGNPDDEDDPGPLKNVIVLARRRPIQEGIIDRLDFSKLFGEYVTGLIEADFLDQDDETNYPDIATSDRQRLLEDDERVVALLAHLRKAFNAAAEQWTDERKEVGAKDVLDEYPELKKWVEARPGWQQKAAKRTLATVAQLNFEKKEEVARKRELLKASVLAFERLALRENSDDLEALSDLDPTEVIELLGRQDRYEVELWGDIVGSRLEAVRILGEITDLNAKERVLQEHIFKHLWLLDPAWERTTGSEQMEEWLHKIDEEFFPLDEDGKKQLGRIDIRYATIAGVHIIVELKRPGRVVTLKELEEQTEKYYEALKSVLESQNEQDPRIEVVIVLGEKPKVGNLGTHASETEKIKARLAEWNAGIRYYQELISNATKQYQEFLEKSGEVRSLNALLESLSPEQTDTN